MEIIKGQPLVSVIIRCYNQEPYIAQAINSVRTQTYDNLEIVVIDDASTDDSKNIISELAFKDKRIKPVLNKINLGKGSGSAKTANKALSKCTGKYVANLDGDDFWTYEDKLQKQVEFLENNPEYVLVGNFVQNVDINGNKLDKCPLAITDDEIRNNIFQGNQFAASSVLFNRESAMQVGGYPEKYGSSIDLGLWLKLGELGKFHNFSDYWHAHRMTGVNIGETKRKQQLQDAMGHIKDNRKDYPGFYKAYAVHLLQLGLFSLPKWLFKLVKSLRRNK